MSIDLKKNNSLDEIKELIKCLFERFNLNYENLISMDRVNDALYNIVIVNDKMSNVPTMIKEYFNHGAQGLYFEDKIYVKRNVSIETLFHEILHFITRKNGGIKFLLVNTYSDEEFNIQLKKYGESKFARMIEQLDESLTRFITELAIPEIEISDSYRYGADILKNYYNSLTNKELDSRFVLNMYLNGSQEDLEKFKNSFGNKFEVILSSVEVLNNIRYYILKKPKDPVLKYEEIISEVNNAVDRIDSRKKEGN